MFESFTQADSSTTRKFGGTGLGTTISKQLVKLMDGEIGLHSVVDVGSTFWIQIPFGKQPCDKDIEENSCFSSMNALIVCDSECIELTRIIDCWNVGYKVINNYNDAQSILEEYISSGNAFNTVILIDSNNHSYIKYFPSLIHSDTKTSNIPIIIIKNLHTEDSIDQYYEYGYTNVIQYPLDRSTLFNAIHALGHNYYGDNIHNIFEKNARHIDDTSSLNILVAEDNRTNQIVISKILERAGHTFSIVNNGQEALDILDSSEESTFDLMILDMQMPVMGGIEATKIYRFTRIGYKTLPVIILTANATTEAVKECEEAKVDAYLTKPIDTKRLLSTIHSLAGNANNKKMDSAIGSKQDINNEVICPTNVIVDTAVIDELSSLSHNSDFIETLIHGFISDTKSLLVNMEKALSANDAESFLEFAHALKGSAGSIGAQQLHNLCRSVLEGKSNESDHLDVLQKAHQTFSKTEKMLLEHIPVKVAKNNNS